MKTACRTLILLLCCALGACAAGGGERPSSLLAFDELGPHISVTREALDEADAATVASR